ncbi:MarR family winged helix-turn-helix transcriptional regulator [Cohnella kolymensis]|nr:MarR family transcriptional regulator [Cohnella kolymensis]
MVKKLEEQLQQYDLTLARLCVLVSLSSCGRPMLPSEISDDLAVTRANISGLLNALENKGLVSREFDASNRRRVLVHLTEAGTKLLEHVYPIYNESISRDITNKLSTDEQDTLIRLVKKLG